MRRKQTKERVTVVKKGYAEKRRSVVLPGCSPALLHVVEERVDRGYRKGVERCSKEFSQGRGHDRWMVQLGYSVEGRPSRQQMVSLSKPSRPRTVTAKERWGRAPDGGTVLLETTRGRKTREEARQWQLGGRRRLWVR